MSSFLDGPLDEPANDRSPRIRADPPTVRKLFFSRTLVNDWRTLGELPRTLAEFARIRAEFAANWRTVRQKSVFIKSFSLFKWFQIFGERLFAAND